MSFAYKTDVIAALKSAGYSSYKIRKEGIINQAALQKLRNGKMIAWDQLDTICKLTGLGVGDLIEHIPDTPGGIVAAEPGRVSPPSSREK